MINIRLDIQYKGTPYSGWQVQPKETTETPSGALVLTGIVSAGAKRIALFERQSSGQTHYMQSGDTVGTLTVDVIDELRVTARQGGQRLSIPLGGIVPEAGPAEVPAHAPEASNEQPARRTEARPEVTSQPSRQGDGRLLKETRQ